MLSPARLRTPTAAIWLSVVLAVATAYTSLYPNLPHDLWWHMAVGRIISHTGTIPTTNLFSWSLPPDAAYTYGAWLGEYLLYLLHRAGGMELVIAGRNLLYATMLLILGGQTRRQTGSWRWAALAVGWTALMITNNLTVRTQMWSWVPFIGFAVVLAGYVHGRLSGWWLLLLPAMMAFWVNVHGAYVLGLVQVGFYVLGESVRWWRGTAGALSGRRLAALVGAAGLTGAATAVNPLGVGIYGYVLDLMTDAPSQGLIMEWQAPVPGNTLAETSFFAAVLLLFLLLIYTREKPTLTEMLHLVGFLWLAWSGVRYIVWFALLAMPLLARAVSRLVGGENETVERGNWLNTALVILPWTAVLLVQPWFVEATVPADAYSNTRLYQSPAGPLLSTRTPVAATAHLARNRPADGRLFADIGHASYLIWALPTADVFIDPRVELYPYEQWLDYIDVVNGYRYHEILTGYGVDRLMLDRTAQARLIRLLEEDDRWTRTYQDEHAELWQLTQEPARKPYPSFVGPPIRPVYSTTRPGTS